MSDRDGRRDGGPDDRSVDGEGRELSERLRKLDQRLGESRTARAREAPRERAAPAGMALAFRLAADFVAGVVVGAAIGWGVDRFFGTTPWGLIVFLLLGFAAGILSVMRSAGLVRPPPGLGDDLSDRDR